MEAQAIKCDNIEIGLGISSDGLLSILMTPQLLGKPLLPGAIALTPTQARQIAAFLVKRADEADSVKKPN